MSIEKQLNKAQDSEASSLSNNVFYQNHRISREERTGSLLNRKHFRGCTIWFTGLSCAGKTSISFALEQLLIKESVRVYALDGDNVRSGLNSDLGFSQKDRTENIRRLAEVARLFADSGTITLVSCISPFTKDRIFARHTHEKDGLIFLECFVDTPLEICERRDIKGLYKRARAGEIKNFTGIDQQYEKPASPDLILKAGEERIDHCVQKVIKLLSDKNIISLSNETEELFLESTAKPEFIKLSSALPSIEISKLDLQWIQVLSEGWATPLKGFMRQREYLQCINFGVLIDDKNNIHNQTIPIVLAITEDQKKLLTEMSDENQSVNLKYNDDIVAVLERFEIYPHRKEERVASVFKTTNIKHPTIEMIMKSGDWLIGGDLKVFNRIKWNDGLDHFRLTPKEIQAKIKEIEADAVCVFQLRNPIHNGHALLMQDTIRQLKDRNYKNPVLLLHPLGGWTKDDDVPLEVRIRQHQAVMDEGVIDPQKTIMAIFPSPMSYAGPREVQWHAKARLVTGAKFYIVGRDPAGIPHPDTKDDLYDPTHGSLVLGMAPGLEKFTIIPFKIASYSRRKRKMVFETEENKDDEFERISGTKMRSLARNGQNPPEGFMVPKAWEILKDYYKSCKN